MTKLQKALKEKAVLERAIRLMARGMTGRCIGCQVAGNGICPDKVYHSRFRINGPCTKAIAAHFKAKAEKGGK